jgi:hypothetical protein
VNVTSASARSLAGLAFALFVLAGPACAGTEAPGLKYADQGEQWTAAARADFYVRDQGSRLIPLRWLKALQRDDATPFLADHLARYGYLAREADPATVLPVGFSLASTPDGDAVGITCAACHTRQIVVNGAAWRIDGGPALADFQAFLADLDRAVGRLIRDERAFADFGTSVLGPSASADQLTALRSAVKDWYLPYHTIVERSLPATPWGVGRLDAVTMIFNRLNGLDIGPGPTHIIESNIFRADAPVRYPFIWNAWRQDKTQWPGFADNGNDMLGLARNLGEVTGVFSTFHPRKAENRPLGIDYLDSNSASFEGLAVVEQWIKRIGPPKWPWPVDRALAAKGEAIFGKTCAQGCHEARPGAKRGSPDGDTWATPVVNVGSDIRQWLVLGHQVDPGVLTGAGIPGLVAPLQNPEQAQSVLKLVVTGMIIQRATAAAAPMDDSKAQAARQRTDSSMNETMRGAVKTMAQMAPVGSYEARVLQGVWAAAPYLHNGSVPTLADLLKPAAERPASFAVGPNFDIDKVGLASVQEPTAQALMTTGCDDLRSGNSRCGHEYGTTNLSGDEKRALLEYLKTL